MGKTCDKCGDYTVCIIGNYYQCPKCDAGSSSTEPTLPSQDTIKIYYDAHNVENNSKWEGWKDTQTTPDNSSGLYFFSPQRGRGVEYYEFVVPKSGRTQDGGGAIKAGTKILSWTKLPA